MRETVNCARSSIYIRIRCAEDEDQKTAIENVREDFDTAFFDCDDKGRGATAFLARMEGIEEEGTCGGDAHCYCEDTEDVHGEDADGC